jgi:RNA polymerase sigma factor (TIGR02999 family)
MPDEPSGRLSREHISELLVSWRQHDPAAREALVSLVYDELHRLAHHYMRTERPGHTLQTTALVNEAYLRLVNVDQMPRRDRTHFVAMAATAMRRILVDHARAHARDNPKTL